MKKLIILGMALLCAGCATTGGRNNIDYARNCGNAMDELGLCSGYYSPHTF
ncbi:MULTISPECIES: hypothetical protein [unclassified Mesorhizobium]|uniref:hypothetical protein n=1 Tax=unclassified Mesorhizobium TaxID=325217 RepID=UPI001674BD0F|nr:MULTISPECIES: hypothetical protein [unclassified Mesorhizobium]